MIVGVILAAGASSRMGTPKPLLKIGEETFLQRIVRVLHSARVMENILVLGSHAEQLQASLSWFDGKIVVNNHWEQGQMCSLRAGLSAVEIEKAHGVIVCPVDRPLLTQSLVVDLLQGFWKSNKNIVLPKYNERRGHPVIFGTSMFDALQTAPMNESARFIIHNHPEEILEVPVDEEGVLVNIDTPDDYKFLQMKFAQ
ncbi:MAG: nucleotidyltransferase family protein [Ignavibacteriae bacterium]|nr:nucleotidyltransferase family protein [Ignavibacteriota bacterium]